MHTLASKYRIRGAVPNALTISARNRGNVPWLVELYDAAITVALSIRSQDRPPGLLAALRLHLASVDLTDVQDEDKAVELF
jgi:hypothetical protein